MTKFSFNTQGITAETRGNQVIFYGEDAGGASISFKKPLEFKDPLDVLACYRTFLGKCDFKSRTEELLGVVSEFIKLIEILGRDKVLQIYLNLNKFTREINGDVDVLDGEIVNTDSIGVLFRYIDKDYNLDIGILEWGTLAEELLLAYHYYTLYYNDNIDKIEIMQKYLYGGSRYGVIRNSSGLYIGVEKQEDITETTAYNIINIVNDYFNMNINAENISSVDIHREMLQNFIDLAYKIKHELFSSKAYIWYFLTDKVYLDLDTNVYGVLGYQKKSKYKTLNLSKNTILNRINTLGENYTELFRNKDKILLYKPISQGENIYISNMQFRLIQGGEIKCI